MMNFMKIFSPNLLTCHFKESYINSRGPYRGGHNIIKPKMQTILEKSHNKGMAFSVEERQLFGIIGLFPPVVRVFEQQICVVQTNYDSIKNPLDKYIYLMALRGRNERLFFRFLNTCIEKCLPVIYTPTVGVACQNYGLLFQGPFGIYVTKYDRGHVKDVLINWHHVTAVCITDGERILGLGDLGAGGMGITVGKILLYTALGNIEPHGLLPVMLDVGTNNQELINGKFYNGIREKRLKGKEYEDLVDEFMQTVVKLYGSSCLIHFEDFATPNAFKFLRKYQDKYCCFNDDIQGTSATGLAGILASERITKVKIKDAVVLFVGGGSATLGTAALLVDELMSKGAKKEEAALNIYVSDVDGLITKDRKNIQEIAKVFAKDRAPIKDLAEIVAAIKPNILIGATGVGKVFNEKVLTEMGKASKNPIIFALSNPTSNAECTAEEAYRFTEGRAIFSSGSPSPPVVWEGKTFEPGQANNSLIFPGLCFGVMASKAKHIPNEMFLICAHTCANYTTDEQIKKRSLYPRVGDANKLSIEIAIAIATYAFDKGIAAFYPKPKNVCEFILENMYKTEYGPAKQGLWCYPEPKTDFHCQ